MRRFIIVTHAYMSKGIVSSVELIMGKQENLSFHCAYVGDKPYQEDLIKELDSYSKEDEIVIFSDLFGGSVNNELIELIQGRKNIHLVTGVNLILVISILLSSEHESIEDIINHCIEESRKGIIYCNNLEFSDDNLLDDF